MILLGEKKIGKTTFLKILNEANMNKEQKEENGTLIINIINNNDYLTYYDTPGFIITKKGIRYTDIGFLRVMK